MNSKNYPIPIKILLLVSFLEGGAVMIIELLGAKIIAPYYGTSLYVWSSVLGVTLGALALGYFLGGVISKKYPGKNSLFMVLLIGAFFTVIAPLIAPQILLLTDGLGVKFGSLASVFLYLMLPITCMGSVSPMIIQLINKGSENAGKSAGTVYAISTVGGILATFLAGFYLIPIIGIKITAFMTGGLLAFVALVYFIYAKNKTIPLILIILFLTTVVLNPSPKESDNTKVIYSSTGILGEWKVLDVGQLKIEGNTQIERRLVLNGIDQTYTQVGFEPLSLWKYPHKIAAYSSMKPEGSKALLLGMAGGSLAYELLAMGMDLDIVDLDERIRHIAKEYFKYNPETSNLFIDDARHYIRNTAIKYDFVVIDLLLGEVQPTHVFSLEGFEDLKKILNEDAIVIINFQGNIDDPIYASGPRSIYKTLEAAGFNVSYFSPPLKKGSKIDLTKDIFFIASLQKQNYKNMMQNLRYNNWFPYEDFHYDDLIRETPLDLSEAHILVDDKPKLEILNAAVIFNWRKFKVQQNLRQMLEEGVPLFD